MPAATMGAGPGTAPGASSSKAAVPFVVGSNHYSERMFSVTQTLDSNAHEFVYNITPGGFLRGVRLIVRATGGDLTVGALAPDAPFSLFDSISLENIDGSPIKYPMSGYAWYLQNKYCAPWAGDPINRPGYSDSVNPAFDLRIYPEIRDTAGCLANTDARAQYRIRFTIGASTKLFTTAPTTLPTVTVSGYMEAWAQTDPQDLHGNPIQPQPDGLSVAAITRHQILTLNGAGADNTFQLTNTGNELRNVLAVVRDSNGARQDYLTDPVRVRLDNRALTVDSPDEIFAKMADFYEMLGNATSTRETGVYVFPRFRRPGDLYGQYWLGTSNATYLIYESATKSDGANLPGTVEWITDEVVPVAPVPVELEGI